MTRSTSASDGINQPTHLVILCCHAVYYGTLGSDPRDENNWALKPFQRSTATKSGEHETFLQHAFAAVQLSNADTLIAFSGGPTDSNYPDLSEARSYLNAFGDWCAAIGLEVPKVARAGGSGEGILLEERATDSYQNVLFSILAFRRRTGYYPEQLTIITHAFKNDRFLHLHSRALKWPAERVKVLGINPPFTRESSLSSDLIIAFLAHSFSNHVVWWLKAKNLFLSFAPGRFNTRTCTIAAALARCMCTSG